MALVFISYTHADQDHARKIQQAIEEAGHKAWRDETELSVGRLIPDSVARGMDICDFFLVLITPATLASPWVRTELNLWMSDPTRADRAIPLVLGPTKPDELSSFLRPNLYADFTVNYKHALSQVLERLRQLPDHSLERLQGLDRLRFAIHLAVTAGTVAMRFYRNSSSQNAQIESAKNPSTYADMAAQNAVIHAIKSDRNYEFETILAEEGVYRNAKVAGQGYTWVIDPLDGTANFDIGLPFFCSAIGVLKDGKAYIGAIYEPTQNRVYYAMEGMRTQIWDITQGHVYHLGTDLNRQTIIRAIFGTHISSRPNVSSRLLGSDRLLRISHEVQQLRALGSGQLALAYVSAGRLQGFFQLSTPLWDQVAGVVLVRNSGGAVIDLSQRRDWHNRTKDLLAISNEKVKREFVSLWNTLAVKTAAAEKKNAGRKQKRPLTKPRGSTLSRRRSSP